MANPLQSLNDNFTYNSMLARALIQLIPVTERNIIKLWLDKLHRMDDSFDEMVIRNEYMWFLLLQLQNKKITTPFNRVPTGTSLRGLKQVLPSKLYEDVLNTTQESLNLNETLTQLDEETDTQKPVLPTAHPATFLQTQPTPRNGIICYFAAFSDQNF